MRVLILCVATLLVISSSCKKDDEFVLEDPQGYNMLLIGNSFFKPYAEKLNAIAMEAGFENHKGTLITRGGERGRPINFWNDSTTAEHNLIKATLDQGGVDFFGMTAGQISEDPTEGYNDWITYALENNPDVTIFLSIPPPDFPADWRQLAQSNGFNSINELYSYFINDGIHNMIIDQLRIEFPSTNIFTIPTGWAAINLTQMNLDNLLLDEIGMMGPSETSIFTDQKGHQGEIVKETGGLLWLYSIYGIDLSSHSFYTGFQTDLQEIASQIMDNHNTDYKQ